MKAIAFRIQKNIGGHFHKIIDDYEEIYGMEHSPRNAENSEWYHESCCEVGAYFSDMIMANIEKKDIRYYMHALFCLMTVYDEPGAAVLDEIMSYHDGEYGEDPFTDEMWAMVFFKIGQYCTQEAIEREPGHKGKFDDQTELSVEDVDIPEKAGCYVIRQKGTNYYKIGMSSNNMRNRVKSFETVVPVGIDVVAYMVPESLINGAIEIESKMHGMFHIYRENGEWFNIKNKEIFIEELKNNGFSVANILKKV